VGRIAVGAALLAAKTESEEYLATMAWLPALKFVVEKIATLLVLSGTWPRKAGPSQNDTIPEGLPITAGVAVTVAVNVATLFELAAELSVIVVALAWTRCMSVALPASNIASPL
jgi:hypothetical protein